jgi:F-type H+-transporting ATPase subunit delta
MDTPAHDTVLDAGSVKSRLARIYAEALLAAAQRQNAVEAVGGELSHFIHDVFDAAPAVETFLTSPVHGKKAKSEALKAALAGRVSDLLRGLFTVLTANGRLGLLRGVSAAYHQLLNDRAGRVPVRVTSAVALTEEQKANLSNTLSGVLKHEPVLSIRVDPGLIGGLVVQIGDRVIDTSVRTRLQSLRHRLLETPI